MKHSRLDVPSTRQKVVRELATGTSQRAIGEEVGVSQAQVSRFASREDVRYLIEAEAMRLVEAVPDAVANMQTLVKELRTLPKKDHKNRELSYRATVKVLEAAGILNTPNLSPTIVNIVQTNTFINPMISELVDRFRGTVAPPDDEVIDFESEDD
jgi:predicted transcriptional regulator